MHVVDNDETKPPALTLQELTMPASPRRDLRDSETGGRLRMTTIVLASPPIEAMIRAGVIIPCDA